MTTGGISVAKRQAPSPRELGDGVTQLMDLAEKHGVDGQGGEPPLGQQGMPDPVKLMDQGRASQVSFVLRAAQLCPNDVQPIGTQLDQLRQVYPDHEAGLRLYQQCYVLMQTGADFQLVTGPAHRLVRQAVVKGALVVLQQDDLPNDERQVLELELGALLTVIRQDLEGLKAARDTTGVHDEEQAARMKELEAEEHLVDVMVRMAAREPVGEAELAEAAATYERYTSEEGPDLRLNER